MAITLPLPVRVAAGLVATGIQLVRSLPEEIPAIPVTLVGNAMRLSMKVQQEITTLATRGDELLGPIIGGRPQASPSWATFDEDTRTAPLKAAPRTANAASARPAPPRPAAAKPAESTPTSTSTPPAESPTIPPAESSTVPADDSSTVPHTPETTALSDAATTATEAAAAVSDAVVEAATHAVPEPAADQAPEPPADQAPDPAEEQAVAPPASDDAAAPAAGVAGAAPADSVDRQATGESDGDDGPATLPGYDKMTLAQVRGHLRELSAEDVSTLLTYEQSGDNRAPFLTLLSNRLVTLGAPES